MSESLVLLSDEEYRGLPSAADGAGFGTLATRRGHLPLAALDVQARLDGLFAATNVRQTFVNTLDEPLEATYIFPLPDRAAVTHFRMEVNGRITDGVLRERGAARRQYEQAIRAGQRAAIAEEDRSGVFSLRVGNLLPGEEAHITLTLVGPLPYSDGEATFRFPLVVAPRYIPGTPLPGPSVGTGIANDTDAVPDASRISPPVLLPGYPNPVRLSLSVAVQPGGLLLRDFRSSLHSVLHDADADGVRTVRLLPGERLDRDFILRFRVAAEAIQTSLALCPDEHGDEGTFLLTLVPPALAAAPRPRDIVFVIDRSGSMAGWKIVAARRALARMIDTLTDRDRFTLYAFDDRIDTPRPFGGQLLVDGTDRHRFVATQFLARLEARGGTEMARPLDLAAAQLADATPDRDRIIVLVTDGQVGNEDQILQTLGPRVRHIRIFTLGIDRSVNAAFLRRLANLGGGACELVESEERLDRVMDRVHRQIGTAVVSALQLRADGLQVVRDTQVPSRLPDLFAAAPLGIMGRYRRDGNETHARLVVEGRASGATWSQTVAARISRNAAVPAVWARGQVRELEDRFASGDGDRARLEQEILATSLRFGVLCRFTAFVAVDRQVANEGGQLHRVTQPTESPSGWAGTPAAAEALARAQTAPAVGLNVSCSRLDMKGEPHQSLHDAISVSTPEQQPLYIHAVSDQPWLEVGPPSLRGAVANVPLRVRQVPDRLGDMLHAKVTITANGNQQLVIPVSLKIGQGLAFCAGAMPRASLAPPNIYASDTMSAGPAMPGAELPADEVGQWDDAGDLDYEGSASTTQGLGAGGGPAPHLAVRGMAYASSARRGPGRRGWTILDIMILGLVALIWPLVLFVKVLASAVRGCVRLVSRIGHRRRQYDAPQAVQPPHDAQKPAAPEPATRQKEFWK